MFLLVKWAKTNAFVFPIGKMKLINMLNLFQPIEFSLSKFDRLDPSYVLHAPVRGAPEFLPAGAPQGAPDHRGMPRLLISSCLFMTLPSCFKKKYSGKMF